MKGAIGLSQDMMMRGRDWLTNTKREDKDKSRRKRKRLSLYGKATVEQIRADYVKYVECLTARRDLYLANIDAPLALVHFIYLDSYEGQQLTCHAWYGCLFPYSVVMFRKIKTRICAAEMAVRYAALSACRKVHP